MTNKEYTLGIIKPNTVALGQADEIIKIIEQAGFNIEAMQNRRLTLIEVEKLYAFHKGSSFYKEYCEYMSSSPVVLMKLAKNDAVAGFRKLIGATNPTDAAVGTIRRQFGTSIEDNVIHGSDSNENAAKEIQFFFGGANNK
ncbi:MAG: nucleoside-diphosphate kinase [Bacteroidota bacterium]